jgi:hypothetical protein
MIAVVAGSSFQKEGRTPFSERSRRSGGLGGLGVRTPFRGQGAKSMGQVANSMGQGANIR